MQREGRDDSNQPSRQFDDFGGFGRRGLLFPSIFGGKDPFDDPFFSRPFGSLFGSSMFGTDGPGSPQQTSRSKGPVIEELDSDDERFLEEKEEGGNADGAWANRNPLVQHPEDQESDHGNNNSSSKDLTYRTNHNKVEGTRAQSQSVSFKKVTYGGVDGAYYSATTSRKTGDDGVTLEESKQADKTTGQAAHRISRGIHDKGHSVTRKLDSDGKVDTVQTLHNLDEEELSGFEQEWKGNADWHTHGFPGNAGVRGSGHGQLAGWGGFADPFREFSGRNTNHNTQAQSSAGRSKKTIRINIE